MGERGPSRYRDGNRSEYMADFVPVEKRFYLYRDAVAIPDEWFRAYPGDQVLRDKLTISGLSSALKAEKRAELGKKLALVADVRMDTELKVGKVGVLSPDTGKARANEGEKPSDS